MLGELLEWLKRYAWKAYVPLKGTGGSNPSFSAMESEGLKRNKILQKSVKTVNRLDIYFYFRLFKSYFIQFENRK